MLEFDQNILSKYHLKETSLYFKIIITQQTKHNSFKICDALMINENILKQSTLIILFTNSEICSPICPLLTNFQT